MKKKIVFIISLCFMTGFCMLGGKIVYNRMTPRVILSQLRYKYNFTNVSQIAEVSDAIVKVRSLGGSKQFLDYEGGGNIPCFGYTITKVEILKVYKSDNLTENQIINFVEPYFKYNHSVLGESYLIADGNYKPLEKNKQYILFINEYDSSRSDPNRYGCYQTAQGEYGRYLINDKINESTDINSLTINDFDIFKHDKNYEKIYVEVMKKYK